MHPPTTVHSLTLQNFRNYAHAELAAEGRSVALVGRNGAGKTNILEALSLLSPGRGLRQARLPALLRQNGQDGSAEEWVVSGTLYSNGESVRLGTSYSTRTGGEKRRVRINGEDVKKQAELGRHLSAVWLTPAMNQLFSEGSGARRRFFDRLVYGFDEEHASRVYAYEHHMRERNRLLASTSPDTLWLETLERKMAEYSTAIAAARLMALEQLNHALQEPSGSAFPTATLELRGDAEDALRDGLQAIATEDRVADLLALSRTRDRETGRASAGAHRTRLGVWFEEKNQEAEYCSTGEQKALLLSIVLAHAQALTHWRGKAPLLLLDEVVAHLDAPRRDALFDTITSLGVQAWMTGTNEADFTAFGDHVLRVEVREGALLHATTPIVLPA